MATAPAGWYPDPSGQAAWRWWDGRQWTDDLYPPPTPPPVPPWGAPGGTGPGSYPYGGPSAPSGYGSPAWAGQPAQQLAQARASEDRLWRWARLAVWLWLAGELAGLIILAALGPSFRHELRSLYDEILHNRPTQGTLDQVESAEGWLYLPDILIIPSVVVFLMWQFQAAKAARLLGYPARISPGLGVGSWFIPVVNFWFPYWALSACLPPSHPRRRLAIWAWLSYLGTSVLITSAAVSSLFSAPAGAALAGFGALLGLLAAWLGAGLLKAVHGDHARAAGGSAVGAGPGVLAP